MRSADPSGPGWVGCAAAGRSPGAAGAAAVIRDRGPAGRGRSRRRTRRAGTRGWPIRAELDETEHAEQPPQHDGKPPTPGPGGDNSVDVQRRNLGCRLYPDEPVELFGPVLPVPARCTPGEVLIQNCRLARPALTIEPGGQRLAKRRTSHECVVAGGAGEVPGNFHDATLVRARAWTTRVWPCATERARLSTS